jgi:hypothetical protein
MSRTCIPVLKAPASRKEQCGKRLKMPVGTPVHRPSRIDAKIKDLTP